MWRAPINGYTLRVSLPAVVISGNQKREREPSRLLEDNYRRGTIGAIAKELKGQFDKNRELRLGVGRATARSANSESETPRRQGNERYDFYFPRAAFYHITL